MKLPERLAHPDATLEDEAGAPGADEIPVVEYRTDTPRTGQRPTITEFLIQADKQLCDATPQGRAAVYSRAKEWFQALLDDMESLARRSDDGVAQSTLIGFGRDLAPYLLMATAAERAFTKPRGYAGDAETIEMLYENVARGFGRLGPLVDRLYLDLPAAVAVRNRRGLLAREIRATIESFGDSRITSLACGPAIEFFDVVEIPSARPPMFTGVDIDRSALRTLRRRADNCGLARHVSGVFGNLVHVSLGRQALALAPQHLIYSIGLIDYLSDEIVVRLLDWIHDHLAPGGRVIVGNFHPRNPCRAFLDYALDWRLIHRDEADMDRLFTRSKFAGPCHRILFEEQGINLFAEALKS